MRRSHDQQHKKILRGILPLLILILAVTAVNNGIMTALALEQPVCCGMEEHAHTEACYFENILVCGKKAHIHSKNCYLVLLEDNNINWLLAEISRDEEKNLTGVIENAVMQGLTIQARNSGGEAENNRVEESLVLYAAPESSAPSESPTASSGSAAQTVSLTSLDISQISALNAVMEENSITPAVVLNESLTTASVYDVAASNEDGGVALAADIVDGSPSTSNSATNLYVYFIDEDGVGSWTFIGSATHSNVGGGQNRRRGVETSTILDLLNTALGTNYTSLPSGTYYATSTTGARRQAGTYGTNTTFGRSNDTYYVYLGAGGTSASAAPNRSYCRVTYVYPSGSSATTYYETGTEITLPTLDTGYVWRDQKDTGKTYKGGETVTLDKSYTLEAALNGYTVTFDPNGGSAVASQTVSQGGTASEPTVPTKAGHSFAGWYSDAALTTAYDFSTAVTSNITLYAKWTPNTYTIIYQGTDGSQISTERHAYGQVISLANLPEGANAWKDTSAASYYSEGASLTVERDHVFQAVNTYTVTLIDSGGAVISTTIVSPGGTYTLTAPDGAYVWEDGSGNTYDSESSFTVNSNLTFTQKGYLTLTYDVNWDSVSDSLNFTPSEEPTVMSSPSYTRTLTQGATETIRAPSAMEVTEAFPLASGSTARPWLVVFRGWQVTEPDGVTTTLDPGTVCTYTDLSTYAVDGTVTLTAQWEIVKNTAVDFFVEYNSTGTSDGSTYKPWTPVLFVCEYLTAASGSNAYDVTTSTVSDKDGDGDKDYYDVDATVREMVETGKLSAFPTDEYVFSILKNYTSDKVGDDQSYLTVDGERVDPDDLHEHGYTIVWKSLVWNDGDGNFHLDGILVRKTGYIYVTKTFSGNEEAITAVKSGDYSITAESQKDGDTVTFNLSNYESYDADANTYIWKIKDVAYGEGWTITENNYSAAVDGVTVEPYMEYTVSDALGSQSRHDEYADAVTVTGQTYDDTIATDEVLTVSFSNIYPGTDSFILKKEDADTGNALAGASFSLYQNDRPLKFTYSDGVYTGAADGTATELDCTSGFLEITIKGLDFSLGNITVKETGTPEGYISLADEVELTKDGDTIVISGGNSTAARMTGGVLIIGNTSITADVAVIKNWADAADARDVVINLLANDSLVTTLFPDIADLSAVVTLTEDGNYAYTWEDLPAYADGKLITWSVAETRIGDERANSDGSFDNWTVVYSDANVSMDADGNATANLTVTNARKSGNTLVLYKTDENGTALPGAQFLLQLLTDSGTVSTDFTAQTGTTDSSGLLTFTGLPYGDYQLTETGTPTGYTGADMIRFTVNSDKTITVTEDGGGLAAAVSGSLVIKVVNYASQPLPDTGGTGTERYTQSGLLLMLAAGCLLIYTKKRRKEEQASS